MKEADLAEEPQALRRALQKHPVVALAVPDEAGDQAEPLQQVPHVVGQALRLAAILDDDLAGRFPVLEVPVTAVEPLVSKSPQPIHSVVVNLVEIDFDRWVVNVMFVRRINWTSCRPVYIPQPQLSDPPENRAA